MRRLLEVDPSRRMTAEEALRHPWIARHSADAVVDADEVAMDVDEECQAEKWSEQEAVVRGARVPMKASALCGRLARGRLRVSVFGK